MMIHGLGLHGRHGKMFERGALKYIILDLINTKPRHGYDIIRDMEESCGGCYSPSPGTVYPTLQMLEDQGFVNVKNEKGKKVYEITNEGKAYLEEHKEEVESHRERIGDICSPHGIGKRMHHMQELRNTFMEIGQAYFFARGDKEKSKAIRELLADTRKQILEIALGRQKPVNE